MRREFDGRGTLTNRECVDRLFQKIDACRMGKRLVHSDADERRSVIGVEQAQQQAVGLSRFVTRAEHDAAAGRVELHETPGQRPGLRRSDDLQDVRRRDKGCRSCEEVSVRWRLTARLERNPELV